MFRSRGTELPARKGAQDRSYKHHLHHPLPFHESHVVKHNKRVQRHFLPTQPINLLNCHTGPPASFVIMSGGLLKPEKDFTKDADKLIPEAEDLAKVHPNSLSISKPMLTYMVLDRCPGSSR